ncbi:hypothetical protein PC121_g6462 [Phytophthora cactorum]|nr:hypothetical protein PC120_g5993 [Phytophthora cactorum]KAG3081351.1 hypothetical protein PC121_g6462 [Phytophthora cactorum]
MSRCLPVIWKRVNQCFFVGCVVWRVSFKPFETAQKQAELPGGSPLPPDLLKLPAGSVTVETFKKQLMLYAGCRTTQDLRGTTCVRSSMEGLIGVIKYLE